MEPTERSNVSPKKGLVGISSSKARDSHHAEAGRLKLGRKRTEVQGE
jgi:hypothetical protein